MNQPIHGTQSADTVDQLIDLQPEDRGRADNVEAQVRKHLAKASVVNLSKASRALAARQEEDDDIWDNVPV